VHLPASGQLFSTTARKNAGHKKGEHMVKGIIAALALGLAAPAFAAVQSDTAKDMDDGIRNGVDGTKDALGTDSGASKAKRHTERSARTVKHKTRHVKNKVKAEVNEATK